ncbi:MAG: hypothetical protein U1E38_10340 [Rhodospirillales bacterium]
MRHPPQRQHGAQSRQRRDLRGEEAAAGPHLGGRRPVAWRHAADGVADATVEQTQAIVALAAIVAGGKAVQLQHPEQEVPGKVASERPAGAVGPPQSRRKTNDQQPDIGAAKGRNGRVVPLREALPHLGAEGAQPGTQRTIRLGHEHVYTRASRRAFG